MKLLTGFVLLASNVFLCSVCQAQPVPSHASSNSASVSVEDLALPRKAVDAYQKGTFLLATGDLEGSISCFRAAIELAPNFSRAYHNLASAQFRLYRLDEAAENFQKAIDLSKGAYARPIFGLSMISYERHQYAQAEALIQRGLLVEPSSALGKYCLGVVQLALGRLTESQQNAVETLRIDPTLYDAHLLLAHIHERNHDPAAALGELQKYFRFAPHFDVQSDALKLRQRVQQDLAGISFSALH